MAEIKERFRVIPTSHLVLVKDGKILLLRRFDTGYEDGNYGVVAGHLDGDETFMQAMVREAKEEAGIGIKAENMEVVHVMHRKCPHEERVDFFIKAKRWDGEPRIMETDKCDDLRWFDIDRLPRNMVSYVRQAIRHIHDKRFYSEFGW